MNNYKTPESSPKKQPNTPPNPPKKSNPQYLDSPNPNDLRRLSLPQNANQGNNNHNRPNLEPRNNQNIQRRLF